MVVNELHHIRSRIRFYSHFEIKDILCNVIIYYKHFHINTFTTTKPKLLLMDFLNFLLKLFLHSTSSEWLVECKLVSAELSGKLWMSPVRSVHDDQGTFWLEMRLCIIECRPIPCLKCTLISVFAVLKYLSVKINFTEVFENLNILHITYEVATVSDKDAGTQKYNKT